MRRSGLVLLVGILAGSAVSLLSSWGLVELRGLDRTIVLSLIPRSITTSFAMAMPDTISSAPELTAILVPITRLAARW